MDWIRTSLTGNIIGSISLVIGVISLIITIKTMKATYRVEKKIKQAQVDILEKKRFIDKKGEYIDKLSAFRKTVSKEQKLSMPMCNDVLSIINDIKGHDTVIYEKDVDLIETCRRKIQNISINVQYKENMIDCIQGFDQSISEIINILEKGEYFL